MGDVDPVTHAALTVLDEWDSADTDRYDLDPALRSALEQLHATVIAAGWRQVWVQQDG